MASTIKHIDSIHVLHELAGASPPNHPLFSIWKLEDLPKITQANFPELMTYGFYSSGLKKNLKGYVKYGRTAYDFQEGALGFKSPLQLLSFNPEIVAHATGWILFFHKDFIAGTKLAERIQGYNFFGYETNEGLHLSKTEEDVINIIYENIYMEYRRPIDKHSKQVMLSNLELLLTYAQRYYSRQFILRNESDSSALQGFEKVLNAFFEDRPPEINGLPTVEYFAQKLCLSPNYLSDMLKSITGKTAQEHIHFKLIEKAKIKLLGSNASIAEIAFELGFEYPQYFSRLFRKKTGFTPTEFRTN